MIELPESKINRLGDISADIGTVAMASVVLPGLFDKFRPVLAIVGAITMIFFWLFSVILTKKV